MLEEEEKARSRFADVPYVSWLAALLALADLKHDPKNVGDCWLAGEALGDHLARPLLTQKKYE